MYMKEKTNIERLLNVHLFGECNFIEMEKVIWYECHVVCKLQLTKLKWAFVVFGADLKHAILLIAIRTRVTPLLS